MTILQLVAAGGPTIFILIFCSILSLAVIIDRFLYYFARSRVRRPDFMTDIRKEMRKGGLEGALKICKNSNTPFANVVHAGLGFHGHSEKEISNNMERTIVVETNLLERHTAIVGTIGSTAVYIGLFGTVLGIIRAFSDISESGTGGINVVINGIAESLACTAAGLLVAVPAVIAYNYFTKKIDSFITDMELCASETMDLITSKSK